ncbi:MAG: MerR family transcriptional regulator [Chloroflexi bacterium]|nr:MerR family transcriptional regulator [Chloroflexota bacterium]
MAEEETYTISQVAEMLSQEYEDLTVSSLRFLEKEGLVTPERTAGGHRRYTQADVERVRFIKEMQRRFFPLSLIQDMLRKANGKKERGEKLFFRPLHYDPDFAPLSPTELAQASGLDEAQLAEMKALGMITSFDEAQDGPSDETRYDEDDLQAAKAMKGLVDYGLEPADMAFYMEHIKAMVGEEIRLMIGKVMVGRDMDEMDIVALHVEELNDELRRVLHAQILRQAAHRLADQFKQFGEK